MYQAANMGQSMIWIIWKISDHFMPAALNQVCTQALDLKIIARVNMNI